MRLIILLIHTNYDLLKNYPIFLFAILTNGKQINVVKNKLIIDKIIDLQSNPVEKNPYKTGGITQVTFCVTGETQLKICY